MIHAKIVAALHDLADKPLCAVDVADVVVGLLHAEQWHAGDECPECDDDHCPDLDAHGSQGDVAVLAEAVQMLHAQAHNGTGDVVYAERCRREPCVTAAFVTDTSGAHALFAPGSRVSA